MSREVYLLHSACLAANDAKHHLRLQLVVIFAGGVLASMLKMPDPQSLIKQCAVEWNYKPICVTEVWLAQEACWISLLNQSSIQLFFFVVVDF